MTAWRSVVDGVLQLRFGHLGTALDATALSLRVKLVAGAAPGSRVGLEAAAPAGRDVLRAALGPLLAGEVLSAAPMGTLSGRC